MSISYKIEWFDSNGDLQSEVINDPDGWEGMQIVLRRSAELVGVFHEFMTDFRFTRKGYERVKQVYDDIGLSGKLWIEADMSGFVFRGIWEPETISFDDELCIATVDFRRDDKVQKFLSRLDTPVDILQDTHSVNGEHELSNWARKNVVVDELPERRVRLLSQFEADGQIQERTLNRDGSFLESFAEGVFGYSDMVVGEIVETFSIDETGPVALNMMNDGAHQIKTSSPHIDMSVKYSIDVSFFESVTSTSLNRSVVTSIRLTRRGSAGIETRTLYSFNSGSIAPGTYNDIGTISGTEHYTDLSPESSDDEFFLYAEITTTLTGPNGSSWSSVHRVTWNNLDVECRALPKTVVSPYPARGSIINEAMATVVESITDGELSFKSDYYSDNLSQPNPATADAGYGSKRILLSGFGIRNFPDPKLKTTLREAFVSLDAIDNVAMSIEGDNVRLEPKSRFFDNQNEAFAFKNIPNIKREIRADLIITGLEVGYEKWDAGFTIGLNEHCSSRNYILKKHDYKEGIKTKLSPYIASGTLIEKSRRLPYRNFPNEDSEEDNSVFIVDLYDLDPITVRNDQDIDNIDNFIDPSSVYNYLLSPATNAARQLKSIMAATRTIAEKLLFRSGEGNTIGEHTFTGDARCPAGDIAENMDFDRDSFISQCGDVLFRPEQISFNSPLSKTEFETIKNNSREAISVNSMRGFIDEIRWSPIKCVADVSLIRLQVFHDPDEIGFTYTFDFKLS